MSMCGAKLLIGQYRELGVLLWRGWGIDDAMAQCFGNEQDRASKGRQMPVVNIFTPNHFHSLPNWSTTCSTGVLPNITFTRSHPPWPHKSHKPPGSLTRFDAIQRGGVKTVRQFTLAKVQRPRAISTRECYLPPSSHPRPFSSPATTVLPSRRRPRNSISAMG